MIPTSRTALEIEASCDAMRRQADAWRKADELRKGAVARLAQLDQQLAQAKDVALADITRMTECVVTGGGKLLELLVLEARLTELFGQVAAPDGTLSDEAKASLASVLPWREQQVSPLDGDARKFVEDCARRIELCLQWIDDCIDDDDLPAARAFCKQASRLTAAMRSVHDSWPWANAEEIDESWRQYRRGELMDFETFQHELLKAAQ